jgi:MEMO1 family protein
MKHVPTLIAFLGFFIVLSSAGQQPYPRKPVDPVGFATKAWQMDSVMARIQREYGDEISSSLARINMGKGNLWKAVICPHDDYAYASWLYPAVLQNVKAKTIILIGVAHKAKQFRLEDKMVFGTYSRWAEPYGPVKVSWYQEKLMNGLPKSTYIIHDSLQTVEHSLEAIVPFLQYYNRDVEIIPILIPYMPFSTMKGLSLSLAKAIRDLMTDQGLEWNRDIAIVISTDAVHYGDEEWGGKNYAPYGTDSAGYLRAVAHEHGIIDSTLTGPLTKKNIEAFYNCTVNPSDYKEYQWTWCGRYSVPFGLLTTLTLSDLTHTAVKGSFVGYTNSINHTPIWVDDLKMGTTAVATLHHWVGYAAIGYK